MGTNLNFNEISELARPYNLKTGGLMIENILDIRFHELLFILLYLFIFLYLINFFIKTQKLNKYKVYFIISYHFFFVIVAHIYSLTNVNDIDTFFQYGFVGEMSDVISANNALAKLNYFLIYSLNLHYFTSYIFLGFFSSFGLVLLYSSFNVILDKNDFNKNILFLLFFFPSWHFFTAFPGKDSIMLLSLGLIYFFLSKKKYIFLILPISLIFLIRPHISYLIFVVSLIVLSHHIFSNLFKSKLSYLAGLGSSFVIIFILVKLLIPGDVNNLINFFETGAYFRNSATSYDGWYNTGNNPLENSFKYIFYPIFDFSSFLRMVMSIENLVLLLILIQTILKIKNTSFFELLKKKEILFSLLFFSIGVIILSNFTSNIGISSRQKWMLLPSLFLLIIPILGKSNSFKRKF
tara:strand:+ start:7400 stop:8620 length:1221 start_codon:yes stop_codon:yes gene_type:complete